MAAIGLENKREARSLQLPRRLIEAALVLLFLSMAIQVNPAVDFLAFYTAGQQVLSGHADRLFDLEAVAAAQESFEILGDGLFPFWYPPLYGALFAPLALLPLAVARLLWGLIGYAAIRAAIARSGAWSGLGRRGTLLLLAFPPLWIAVTLGQITPLTLLIFTTIAWVMWQGRPGVRTGLLAALALYKPQLLIPLVLLWLVRREWRALGGFTLGGLGIAAGSLLLSPTALYEYFFAAPTLMPLMQEELAARGTVTTLATVLIPGNPSGLTALLPALLILTVLIAAWRRPVTTYHHALLWLAVVLSTPYLGHYDLLLLLLPLTFLAPLLREDRWMAGAVGLLALSFLSWALGTGMAPPVAAAGLLWALCALRTFQSPVPLGRGALPAAGLRPDPARP